MGLVARWLLMGCWVVDDCREVEEDCGATIRYFWFFFFQQLWFVVVVGVAMVEVAVAVVLVFIEAVGYYRCLWVMVIDGGSGLQWVMVAVGCDWCFWVVVYGGNGLGWVFVGYG